MVKYMNKSVSFESLRMDGFRVGFKWVPVYFRVLLETEMHRISVYYSSCLDRVNGNVTRDCVGVNCINKERQGVKQCLLNVIAIFSYFIARFLGGINQHCLCLSL